MAYDSPDHTVRREHSLLTVAGATTESGRMVSFQKMRLKRAHAQVVTAGTATTHALTIRNGTTSIGSIALSTLTANSNVSSAVLNATFESMQRLNVLSGADATGVALVTYEYEVLPDAVSTA
jgi:hypothetical protein